MTSFFDNRLYQTAGVLRPSGGQVLKLVVFLLSLFVGLLGTGLMSAHAAGTGDDYPAYLKTAAQDSIFDPWLFYNRECTSFAAWRLNQQSGRTASPWSFNNNMRGPNGVSVHFGNANQWLAAAQAGGWSSNHTPAVGAVAYWGSNEGGASSAGHVAIVTAVRADGSVNVEEYNYGIRGGYGTRGGVRASWYLHIADQPAPTGSNPIGNFEGSTGRPGAVWVRGWSADRDNPATAIPVHIYIGGHAGQTGAEGHAIGTGVYRPDVDTALGFGTNHGFSTTIKTTKRGSQLVCAYGINVGLGSHTLLRCLPVTINDRPPVPTPIVRSGTAGPDTLVGASLGDVLRGLAGNDILKGLVGNDRLFGGLGADRIYGGPGSDKISGGRGRDIVVGGAGNDLIDVRDGVRDSVNCGVGVDSVNADPADRLVGCERRTRARVL